MDTNTLTIAAIQLCSSICVNTNINTSSKLIRSAAKDGASIIFTPEMTSIIDKTPKAVINQAYTEDKDPALKAYQELAKELAITLVIGSLPIKVNSNKCANRCFVLLPNGDIAYRYDKIHMFDVNLASSGQYLESADYEAGNIAIMAQLTNVNLGLSICYDLRFPMLYQRLALAGANIICVPAAFTATTGKAHWEVLLRARAIETGAFIIAPAQGGIHEDGRRTFGHSMIINPWGEVINQLANTEPAFICSKINLNEVNKARHKLPNLKHSKAFTLGKLQQ